MDTRLQKLAIPLALMLVLTLTGCMGFGSPIDQEDLDKIDQRIRAVIEKTFPLPEQAVIKTHVGNDLLFATRLSVNEVVEFYRDAYNQKGFEEIDSQIQADSATLLFNKAGQMAVDLEVTGNENGCDVHLLLKQDIP